MGVVLEDEVEVDVVVIEVGLADGADFFAVGLREDLATGSVV